MRLGPRVLLYSDEGPPIGEVAAEPWLAAWVACAVHGMREGPSAMISAICFVVRIPT
jgi:hypothetical protein